MSVTHNPDHNSSTIAPRKVFVRFSEKADADRIMAFYRCNSHQNVLERDHGVVRDLIGQGAVVLLEDVSGTILGASIVYPHGKTDIGGNDIVQWQEMGTTRLAINGFPGLLDTMIALQALRTFLVEPPADRFVCKINTTQVQQLVQKQGWRKYAPPAEMIQVRRKVFMGAAADTSSPPTESEKSNWLHLGLEGLPHLARAAQHIFDNPVLTNKKDGTRLELDFSRSLFFRLMSPEIRHLAARDLGDVENPDMKRSVAQGRAIWMKKYFR